MSSSPIKRRAFLGAMAGITAGTTLLAQEPAKQLKEPIFRVGTRPEIVAGQEHPLDPALKIAREGLAFLTSSVKDYECTLVKRERVGTELHDYEYMFAKVRSRRVEDGKLVSPLSVYLRFLKPDAVKGREVLWVEGTNNGKLLAHEGGRLGAFTPAVWLAPEGAIAMRGNRYPVSEIGVENLVVKLIEKGERDRKHPDCEVNFFKDSKINGRACTLLEVKHPIAKPHYDFHVAQIYIDSELNVPVRYAAYAWPEAGSDKPLLLEEYTYLNMKLNVGLTDDDFDPHNKKYNFH